MKISSRELGLVWITLVAVLVGGAYWWGEPQLRRLREEEAGTEQMVNEQALAKHKIGRREEYEQKLRAFRDQLPRHAANAPVTADLMKMVEKTASESSLVLITREPSEERSLGDLFEVSILCSWEGSLDALVRFLYAIQTKGAILDISLLQVKPKQGKAEMLSGRFTVDCAYSRESVAEQKQDETGNT